MNSDLPEYRPLRSSSGAFVPIPVSRENCERLVARWKYQWDNIDHLIIEGTHQGWCEEDLNNLQNLSGGLRRCARELSAVVQGQGVPAPESAWPETVEDL